MNILISNSYIHKVRQFGVLVHMRPSTVAISHKNVSTTQFELLECRWYNIMTGSAKTNNNMMSTLIIITNKNTFFVEMVGIQQCGHTLQYVTGKQKKEVLQLVCNTACKFRSMIIAYCMSTPLRQLIKD